MSADVQRAKHIGYKMTERAGMGVMDDAQADGFLPPDGSSEYGDHVGDDEENNSPSPGPSVQSLSSAYVVLEARNDIEQQAQVANPPLYPLVYRRQTSLTTTVAAICWRFLKRKQCRTLSEENKSAFNAEKKGHFSASATKQRQNATNV